ncbi:MAG TPA: Rrf2 family transcriptional regulator [Candidatus Dormibacteraeota bacterium]|nr:Rrf2 family transcriptional regulator [Candidatus Dormibacteraeota bacterium]
MRLTQFTDFGMRALVILADREGEVMSTAAIAESLDVSVHHMAKVLQALGAAGFVRSLRGKQGGVTLARPAAAIRVGAVVRALEADQPLVECCRSDGGACVLTPACRLRSIFIAAEQAFLAHLDRVTLADCRIPDLARWLMPAYVGK